MPAALFAVLLSCVPILAAGAGEIHVVELDGVIHPVSAAYIVDAIERADQAGAAALVIAIDSPGGLVTSTEEIIQRIFAAKTPVIGFVTPAGARAASGGFFVLLACDAAAMSPGTRSGAAHPVTGSGEDTKEQIGMQKAESDLAAYARSIAENRGRNVELAEKAVRDSASWSESEALKGRLIDAIANDVPELLGKLDGRTVKRIGGATSVLALQGTVVASRAMTTAERFKRFLLVPEVAFLLLGVGMLGLYIEMNHPGLIFPGVAGMTALLLFAYAAHILPVNLLALLLIVLAVVLFILEIKFVSHGLLGLGGLLALVAGSLFLIQGEIPELRVHPGVVIPVSLAVGGIMLLIVTTIVRARREKVATGKEGMVGEIGIAATHLGPEGKIFVHGEYWNARAIGAIPRGAKVRIRAVEAMMVLVEPQGDRNDL